MVQVNDIALVDVLGLHQITSDKTPKRDGTPAVPQQASASGSSARFLDQIHTNIQHAQPIGRGSLRDTEKPKIVNIRDLTADDIVIVVMGPTGSGKSTFVCAASGDESDDANAVGHSLTSFTQQVSVVKFWDQECGRHIVLVDTPGFDDTTKSDLDTLRVISNWLVSCYKQQVLLSGILYLHRITDNRVTGSSLKNLRVFRKLCGRDALDKVYLTTTMWDEVELGIGQKRLEELETEYWNAMIAEGAWVARCMRDDGSPKRLVRQIALSDIACRGIPPQPPGPSSPSQERSWRHDISHGGRKVLLIQKEMAKQNKELKETAAGQQLYSQLETLVEKQLQLLQRISKEMRGTSDPVILQALQGEYKDLQARMRDKSGQMRQLKLPWLKRFLSCGRV